VGGANQSVDQDFRLISSWTGYKFMHRQNGENKGGKTETFKLKSLDSNKRNSSNASILFTVFRIGAG